MKLLVKGAVTKPGNKRSHFPYLYSYACTSEGKLPSPCWFCVYTLSVPIHKCNKIHINKIKNKKWQSKYKQPFLCVCVFLI